MFVFTPFGSFHKSRNIQELDHIALFATIDQIYSIYLSSTYHEKFDEIKKYIVLYSAPPRITMPLVSKVAK